MKAVVRGSSNRRAIHRTDSRRATSSKHIIGGGAMDLAGFIKHEIPSPAPNGVAVVFTTAYNFRTGSLDVYQDGLLQIKTTDYVELSNNTFQMTVAPASDETIEVGYIRL